MTRYRIRIVLLGCLLSVLLPGIAQAQRSVRERPEGEVPPARKDGFEWRRDKEQAKPQLVPTDPTQPARWFLGIRVAYRDTGAECVDVVERSPAGRAGLEPEDLIVAVDGYQVGYVRGRLYRLERELEIRANRSGQVRLLVQDQRDGHLANVDVRLELPDRRWDLTSRENVLSGTVTSRRISQVPEDAVLVVSLVDVTDRRSSLQPIAQRTYDRLGPLPMPFELPYDSNRLRPEREYILNAYVTLQGETILSAIEGRSISAEKPPGRIKIELERVR